MILKKITGLLFVLLVCGIHAQSQLYIDNNVAINIQNGVSLIVQDINVTNKSYIKGGGYLVLKGIAPLTISGVGSIDSLIIDNIAGVSIASNIDTVKIVGILIPSSGTFNTNGSLLLMSTANGTASIAQGSGTYLTGNVTVQRYLSAKRGWRLLGDPFSSATTLSSFATASNIDMNNGTGSAPTVYTYDATKISPATPWVTANASWNGSSPLLLFIRGTAGQGVGGGTYTPSNVTLSNTGAINQGNQSAINLTYDATNTNATWNIIANPYPAPVSAKAITGLYGNSNINQSIYYFNPNKAATNAYTADGDYDFTTLGASQDFIIPSFGAILVQTQSAGQSLTFTESSKSTSANVSTALYGIDDNKLLEFQLIDGNNNYVDKLQVRYDAGSTSKSGDHWDLPKQGLSSYYQFYTLSNDNQKLAIDSRANTTDIVPLGLQTTVQQNYTIKVSQLNVPQNTTLYLRDKLLNTETKLAAGTDYSFTVTADNNTKGDGRFEIFTKPVSIVTLPSNSNIQITVSPNPVKDVLNITSTGNTTVTVINVLGQVVRTVNSSNQTIQIPVSNLNKGVYIVEVKNDTNSVTEKIVKQ